MTTSGDYSLIATAHSYPIVQNIITGIGKKISHIKIENNFFYTFVGKLFDEVTF